MKFKAEEFLKDIGLDLHISVLERTVEVPNSVSQLPVANVSYDIAVIRTVDNLVATYGTEAVHSVLKKLVNE